ncbi:MAG: hypothetical protein J5809_04575 [Selenomonadaceae bacterium]|nr:hypothetical protein [Selenomonadaceae bacterium]
MAEEKNYRRSEIMSDEELDNVVGGAPQFEYFSANGNKIPEFVQKMIVKDKSANTPLLAYSSTRK